MQGRVALPACKREDLLCASAAEPSAVANTSAIESAIIVLLNIDVSPGLGLSLTPFWCPRTLVVFVRDVNQPEVLPVSRPAPSVIAHSSINVEVR